MKILLVLSILLLNTLVVHSGPIQDGVYYIINRAYLQVIEISDWSESNGAAISFDSISGGDNQQFQLTSVGDGDFYKITSLYSGKVLTAPSFQATDTSQITQWDDTGEDLQQWNIFAQDTSGFYVIQSRYSGQVLTAEQEYVYLPLEATTNTAVGEDVAAAGDTSTAADTTVSQATDAQASALFRPPWYSTQNKIIQSTITVGNTYQDFLFIQVAGSNPVMEPLAAPQPTGPVEEPVAVHISRDPIPLAAAAAESGLDNGETEFSPAETEFPPAALGQEVVPANNGFLANNAAAVGEAINQESVVVNEEAGLQ